MVNKTEQLFSDETISIYETIISSHNYACLNMYCKSTDKTLQRQFINSNKLAGGFRPLIFCKVFSSGKAKTKDYEPRNKIPEIQSRERISPGIFYSGRSNRIHQ